MQKLIPLLVACVTLFPGACVRKAPVSTELAAGARVQFTARGWRDGWTAGIVGTVGNCTAVMVPDDWNQANRFRVVRIDSISALRVSTKYDGLVGPDGQRRTVKLPPDTVGETWTQLPVREVQARYACES